MPVVLDIDERPFVGPAMGQSIRAIHPARRNQPRLGTTRDDFLSRLLEPRLDVAEHRQDFRRVRFLHQDRLALLHGHRVGAAVEIGFRQPARRLQRIGFTPDFRVRFLEDFERLIIVRLRLEDDLKHLDRLHDLRMLLLG